MPSRILFGWALFFLGGCSALLSPRDSAWQFASEQGFVEVRLPDAHLKGFLRQRSSDPERLTVYIEGDGAPWPWPDQPPVDPTPLKRMVLDMAGSDSSTAVAYLGRPCQYLSQDALVDCHRALWTDGRFSEEAVAATVRAVEALRRASGASRVALVGYSGGGAMATLVAADRADTACLVTLAAPLDTVAWTDAIGVSRLSASRNPADIAARLAGIPQTHLRGRDDRLVPPPTAARFLRQVPAAQVIDLDGVDHQCCWRDVWTRLRVSTCLAP